MSRFALADPVRYIDFNLFKLIAFIVDRCFSEPLKILWTRKFLFTF
jgi:hypothetical protein